MGTTAVCAAWPRKTAAASGERIRFTSNILPKWARRTKSLELLPAIVHGLIEHYVERDARAKLSRADDGLRLVEDLAIDSLTMLEIVFLAEDVLQISIDNEDLRPVRTVGDVKTFIASKLATNP